MSTKSLILSFFKTLTRPEVTKSPAGTPGKPSQKLRRTGGFASLADFIDVASDGTVSYEGNETFDFDIVGESNYQTALSAIVGGPTLKGHQHACVASLIPEMANPHDASAVAVKIEDQTVGYLARKHAKEWRAALLSAQLATSTVLVPAMIVGGWENPKSRSATKSGSFGVKLDLDYDTDF